MITKPRYRIVGIILKVLLIIFLVWLVMISAPTILELLTLSLLVMTIGIALDTKPGFHYKIAKFALYFAFTFYSLWRFGFFSRLGLLKNYDALDWTTIMFTILAPICMLIIGYWFKTRRIKGRKVLNYYTFWLLYLVIAIIWELFYPQEVVLEFIILYFAITFVLIYYYKKKSKRKSVF